MRNDKFIWAYLITVKLVAVEAFEMDLGNEISHKFKASIKRKLKECGTYIDDELPEYIMVMIANKRKSQQMVDDLSLFLGEETDGFVKWLFQTLGKLQSAAQDAIEDHSFSEPEKEQGTDSRLVQETEAAAQEKEAEKGDKEIENDKKELDRKEKSKKENVPEDKELRRKGSEKEENDEITRKETKNDKIDKAHEDKDERSEVRKRREENISSGKASDIVTSRKDKGEESRKDSTSTKRRRSSSSKAEESEKRTIETSREDRHSNVSLQSAVSMQKIRPSLPRSRQATGLLVQRAIKEANQSVTVQPRRQSTSHGQVEVVTSGTDTVERRVHLKRGRSNVEDNERHSDKEDGKEPDAEEEDLGAKKKRVGDPDKSQEDGIELEVVENEFLEEEKEPKFKSSKRIVIANRGSEGEDDCGDGRGVAPDAAAKEIKELEKENCLDQTEAALNADNRIEGPKEEEEDRRREKADSEARRERRKKRHRRDRSTHSRERRRNSPKFVVTLHGALDGRVKDQRKKRQLIPQDNYDHPMFIDLHPRKPMEILESAQKEIEKMAQQLDLMQNVTGNQTGDQFNSLLQGPASVPPLSGALTSVTRPVFQEALPALRRPGSDGLLLSSLVSTPPAFTGVLPLQTPLLLMQNARKENATSSRKQHGREVIIPLNSEEDDPMNEVEIDDENNEDEAQEQKEAILERCRFWPNCKNGSCAYVHPSKPCRMFPNCNFKEKCIFVHPMCKFDGRCSNSSCPYSHSLKANSFSQYSSKAFGREISMDKKVPICKFVPNCTRSNCPFRHPSSKPCRYGSGCKRMDCPYHHETRPAKKEDLKWSSTSRLPDKHISERAFAAAEKEVTEAPVTLTA